MSKEFIIVNHAGEFFGWGGEWVKEYPSAKKFALVAANKEAKPFAGSAFVVSVEDYQEGRA